MNTLSLDLTDPDMAKALADCKEGETKTFTNVTGTLLKKSDSTAVFSLSDVEYSGDSGDESPAEDAAESGEEPADAAAPKKRKTPPAVAEAMSGKY